jgi:hypothetical protein
MCCRQEPTLGKPLDRPLIKLIVLLQSFYERCIYPFLINKKSPGCFDLVSVFCYNLSTACTHRLTSTTSLDVHVWAVLFNPGVYIP